VLPKQCSFYTRLREVRFRSGSGFRNSSSENIIKKKRIAKCIVDETLIKVGSELTWHRVAIESKNPQILVLTISKERNMFVTERFLSNIAIGHGKHPVSTDGGTWYPQACGFLKPDHHIHSSFEKSLIER
jgi:putative transposase